jgi:membrane peptidoglycan carboxypeptidase
VPDEPISVSDGQARPRKWIANYDGRFKGPIPVRQALAESRNAVAIWLTAQIGIDSVLRTSRNLGVHTPLGRFPTTALGASEMTLLELANAYHDGVWDHGRPSSSIGRGRVGRAVGPPGPGRHPAPIDGNALSLIQEGMRGVHRAAHRHRACASASDVSVAVMGKTGTTNEFKDAVFVGSTYGPDGITAAVRIGFDDNRSLGSGQTGGRLALPVFQELMLGIYRAEVLGNAPAFPVRMENRIAASCYPSSPPGGHRGWRGLPGSGRESWRRVFRSEHLPGSQSTTLPEWHARSTPLDHRGATGGPSSVASLRTPTHTRLVGDAVLCTDVRADHLPQPRGGSDDWLAASGRRGRPLRDVFHVVDGDTSTGADPVNCGRARKAVGIAIAAGTA